VPTILRLFSIKFGKCIFSPVAVSQDHGDVPESVIRKFPNIPFLNFRFAVTISSLLKLFTIFEENAETSPISQK